MDLIAILFSFLVIENSGFEMIGIWDSVFRNHCHP